MDITAEYEETLASPSSFSVLTSILLGVSKSAVTFVLKMALVRRIVSKVKAVGDCLSQLAPNPAESEAMVQSLAVEARTVAEGAINGAHKFAEHAAGEAQKIAANAVADVGKW